jgi:hypothetical protein
VLGVLRLRRTRAAASTAGPVTGRVGSPLPLLAAGAIALVVYYFAAGRYTGSELGIHYHVYSLPYAAIAIGTGVTVVIGRARRRLNRTAVTAVAGAVVVLLGAQSVNVFAESLPDHSGAFGVCAAELDAVSAPDDLVVVSTSSRTVQDGVTNNYQEPVVFFLADRRGWSLAADQHTPDAVAALRAAGARFLVVEDPHLVPAGGALATWLAENTHQLRSSAQDGCGIWDLAAPS